MIGGYWPTVSTATVCLWALVDPERAFDIVFDHWPACPESDFT